MIRAAVYNWSYGADERGDYKSSCAEESLRDADLETWLRDAVHAPFTPLVWSENQTVFVCTHKDTSKSHYIVLARFVGRYTAQSRFPFVELVAIYVDSGRIKESDLLGIAASVPWDRLIENRPGFVDIAAFKPSSQGNDDPLSSLSSQISRKAGQGQRPIRVDRFWESLSNATVLYWCLSGLPSGNVLFSTVVTGVSKEWPPILDAQVIVHGARELTQYDPGSKQYKLALAAERGALLEEYTPVSYEHLSTNLAGLNLWIHMVKLAHQNPSGSHAAFPLAPVLSAFQDSAAGMTKTFGEELKGRAESHFLSSGVVDQVKAAWRGLFDIYSAEIAHLVQNSQQFAGPKTLTRVDVESTARRISEEKILEREVDTNRRLDRLEKAEHDYVAVLNRVNRLEGILMTLQRQIAESHMQPPLIDGDGNGSLERKKEKQRVPSLRLPSNEPDFERKAIPIWRHVLLGVIVAASLLFVAQTAGWLPWFRAGNDQPVAGGEDSAKSPAIRAEVLFDGKSLEGWSPLGYAERDLSVVTGWDVKDGALRNAAGATDLATNATYKYFDLKLQYKLRTKEGDSGVLLRVDPNEEPGSRGLEVALSQGGKFQEGEVHGLYNAKDPKKRIPQPIGVWNDLRIVVSENECYTELNGEKCCTFSLDEARKLLDGQAGAVSFTDDEAPIVLQGGKGNVAFRKIRLTRLKQE